MPRVHALLVSSLALSFAVACGTLSSPGEPDGPVAARVGGETVTVAELDDYIKDDLFQRETRGNPSRTHDLRSRALEELIAERVVEIEAAQRGLSAEALLDAELEARGDVSDADVETFYRENAARLGGASLEDIGPRIRTHLEVTRRQEIVQALVSAADVRIELERPQVAIREGGPSHGPADARVTIVEFSDFQCPYCQRALPLLENLREKYPEDVRVVYRHLPLDSIHPRARAGAEASMCADEGDRFWEYHDLLFANPRAMEDEDLRRYAEEVGLDAAIFDECLTTRRYADEVQADTEEALALGITGTPAFVVNGTLVFGLQPQEAFEEIIREELAGSDS